MKRRLTVLLLVLALLLCGCDRKEEVSFRYEEAEAETEVIPTTEETVPPTIAPDGNPEDVTCKGSYTGSGNPAAEVAVIDGHSLSNEELQIWYWAAVSQYRQEAHETAPDFDKPLDTQPCEIDSSVNSWQQYFLKQALSSWHTTAALAENSKVVPMTTEEAYKPNLENHEKYMPGMPAREVLYGYHTYFQPNSMHQAYLDAIPEKLQELAQQRGYGDAAAMAEAAFGTTESTLQSMVSAYNLSYMYFTNLGYGIEPSREELDAYYAEHGAEFSEQGIRVDFRQILLVPQDILAEDNTPSWQKDPEAEPVILEKVDVAEDGSVTCSEEAWAICEAEAQELLTYWQKKTKQTEATFGEVARKNSQDAGTMVTGGLYQGIRKGQMTQVLDDWCFDPARQVGDTVILRSQYGVHILYFCGSREAAREEAETDYYRTRQLALISEAKAAFPMEVEYSSIVLTEAEPAVSSGDLLYPDIAHERFPEIPLYLQQDYIGTMYGGFKITTNGCGITTFAMVASYLADDELTPPEMAARYGRYSHANGTDGMIFNNEPAVLGFYLREKTYDTRVAKAALEEGHVVVSIQHPGYWTRGGHYIACERMTEDGLIQVRDSNIYNYSRVAAHREDAHKWGNITAAGSGYWIFEYKITEIPACSRCGNPEGATASLLNQDYICQKCEPALLRRDTYLHG